MTRTYYEVLEVSPTASEEIIQCAYKTLAKKYHPDVFEGSAKEANQRMAELNAAYEVLSDADKRKKYDAEIKFSSSNHYTESREPYYSDLSPANRQNRNSTISSNAAEHLGRIIGAIIKYAIFVAIIYFVIHGFDDGFPSFNSDNRNTDSDSISSLGGTEWICEKIADNSGKSLYATLPLELSEALIMQGGDSSAEYQFDNWGVKICAYLSINDNSYDGSVSDFMFEYLSDEFVSQEADTYYAFGFEPLKEYGQKKINGITWKICTISGNTLESGSMSMTKSMYFYMDDTVTAIIALTSAYVPSKMTQSETKTMSEWLKTIPSSFEIVS